MPSSVAARRSQILSDLTQSHEVNVAQLSARFGVSDVIIRRDLENLERDGLLRRIHGGAVPLARTYLAEFEAAAAGERQAEKERIGRAAAEMVNPGERIFLDSGTTVLQLARHIPPRLQPHNHLTVVTNSLHIVRELGRYHGVDLLLLGGLYLPQYDIVVGPSAVQDLHELRVDKTFMGTKGLMLERGISTTNVLEAETDRAAVEAASQVILLADSSKIGVDSLAPIVPLTRIYRFITDDGAPADLVAAMRAIGIEVCLV